MATCSSPMSVRLVCLALAVALAAGLALPLLAWAQGARSEPAIYTVQPGDTLYGIARAHGLDVNDLAAWNGLPDASFIREGQVLLLGRGTATETATTHTVQPGDTLYSIAARYAVPVSALIAWNGLPDPPRIVVGTNLKLTAGGDATEAALRLLAEWAGSPNFWPGRPSGEPIALVIHTMGGTLAGARGEFANPASGASAHFGISLAGQVHQYVDLSDRAWANGGLEPGHLWPGPAGLSPNDLTVSIETEDLGDPAQVVTPTQYEATLRISRLVLRRYPSIQYLITHRAISPQTRADDPGARWITSGYLEALATALGLKLVA